MSVSGTYPVNSGWPFKAFAARPPVRGVGASSPLEQKIDKALAEVQDDFTALHAAELKKRVAFYSRFEGTKIGDRALGDVAHQIDAMLHTQKNGWVI